MYNNLTDSELLNLQPNTELEAELIKRLTGSTEQDWDGLKERCEDLYRKERDANDFAERLRGALAKVMTEVHRCADFGTVEVTPKFREQCEQVVRSVDEFVNYDYPKESPPKNNTSSFSAGGKA